LALGFHYLRLLAGALAAVPPYERGLRQNHRQRAVLPCSPPLVASAVGHSSLSIGDVQSDFSPGLTRFSDTSRSPGAEGCSSTWISRIRSPIEARSLNMLVGVDRGRCSTRRGTQVNVAVRNSLLRPPHQRQVPSTKSCSRTISSMASKALRAAMRASILAQMSCLSVKASGLFSNSRLTQSGRR